MKESNGANGPYPVSDEVRRVEKEIADKQAAVDAIKNPAKGPIAEQNFFAGDGISESEVASFNVEDLNAAESKAASDVLEQAEELERQELKTALESLNNQRAELDKKISSIKESLSNLDNTNDEPLRLVA